MNRKSTYTSEVEELKCRRETGHCEAERVDLRPVSTLETLRPASFRTGSPFRTAERPLTGAELSRSGTFASLDLEIWSKRGLSLLLRNSVEKSKVLLVLENALTLLDLRIGGALFVVVVVVGVEVEEDDDD
jgi:hypothetical protein